MLAALLHKELCMTNMNLEAAGAAFDAAFATLDAAIAANADADTISLLEKAYNEAAAAYAASYNVAEKG
jgi:hypothetical protein